MQHFDGRTAVITGGAGGIGFAVADRLGRADMNIVLADIEGPALARAAALLESDGIRVLAAETDVADFDSMRALAAATEAEFGDVHVLFNNAGVAAGGPVLEPDDLDMWKWVLDTDLYGVVHGIKAFGPAMVAHGAPCHIVNTASMAGLLPTPMLGPYTVAKYGVVALSEVLSLETRDTTRLGVSVLCPGFVRTEIFSSDRNISEHLADLREPTAEQELLRTMVEDLVTGGIPPEEVAEAVHDAIYHERFYVLPHPQYGPQITARAADIVAGASPRSWDI